MASEHPQPVYFLHYLHFRGRGEPVRWLLKVSGAEYKEERIDVPEWSQHKSEFEWGVVPVLEVNGVQLHQTMSICRYLARNHNLAPVDNFEQARLGAIAESVNELTVPIALAYRNRLHGNMNEIPELLKKVKVSTVAVLEKIDKTISNEGWIRSKTMTWCDIVVACYIDIIECYFQDVCQNSPKLEKMVNEVRMIPVIRDWISSRPPMQSFERKF